MQPEQAILKLSVELRQKLEEEEIAKFLDPETLQEYLQMAYCVGFDQGKRVHSNQKPVIQLSKYGKKINEYPSAAQASRSTKTDHTSIVNCCKNKQHKAGGYLWQYKEEYKNQQP